MKLNTATFLEFTTEPLGDKDVSQTLHAGCEILALMQLKYWLSGGTLLSLYRDGSHNPKDTEISIGALGGSGHEVILIDFMASGGFKFVRSVDFGGQQMQMTFLYAKLNILFNIFFYYEKRDKLVNMTESGPSELSAKFFHGLGTLIVNGDEYPIPNDMEEYLREVQ